MYSDYLSVYLVLGFASKLLTFAAFFIVSILLLIQ